MDFNSSLKHFLLSLSTNPSVLRANTLFSAKENCRKDSKRKLSSLKFSLNLSLVSARSQHLVGTLVFSHLVFASVLAYVKARLFFRVLFSLVSVFFCSFVLSCQSSFVGLSLLSVVYVYVCGGDPSVKPAGNFSRPL